MASADRQKYSMSMWSQCSTLISPIEGDIMLTITSKIRLISNLNHSIIIYK